MRALTNQLLNVSHLLILPVSLIVVIFGISIAHYQDSQTQPIQPHLVSNNANYKSGVELQQAYKIPTVADNYVGNNSQQLANNAAASPSSSVITSHPSSNISSNIAVKAQPTANPQLAKATPTQNTSSLIKVQLVMNSMSLSADLLSND